MIIAAAQIASNDESIHGNLQDHRRLIQLAADHGVQCIAFPELSITGYTRASAPKLAFTAEDSRLDPLRRLAVDTNMIVVAGAPIELDSGLHIGSFVLFPAQSIAIYTKQFLHPGEEEVYVPSVDHNPVITLEGERLSLAICADIDHPQHAENAHKAGCVRHAIVITRSTPS